MEIPFLSADMGMAGAQLREFHTHDAVRIFTRFQKLLGEYFRSYYIFIEYIFQNVNNFCTGSILILNNFFTIS